MHIVISRDLNLDMPYPMILKLVRFTCFWWVCKIRKLHFQLLYPFICFGNEPIYNWYVIITSVVSKFHAIIWIQTSGVTWKTDVSGLFQWNRPATSFFRIVHWHVTWCYCWLLVHQYPATWQLTWFGTRGAHMGLKLRRSICLVIISSIDIPK